MPNNPTPPVAQKKKGISPIAVIAATLVIFAMLGLIGNGIYQKTFSTTSTHTPITRETPLATATPLPTPIAVQATEVTFAQICEVDEHNMTAPQFEAHAAQFAGQAFRGWQGWVYEVVSRSDGSNYLQIAMEEPARVWTRDILIENIPDELAASLHVRQPITFSGRVAAVEYALEIMCNPLKVDHLVLQE